MADSKSPRTRVMRQARRISASSDARVALPRFTSCVLDLLGLARPRAHADSESTI